MIERQHDTPQGERMMMWLRKLCGELGPQINETKRAVCGACRRKFLGYELWGSEGQGVKCPVAVKALGDFKASIRQFTRRTAWNEWCRGCSRTCWAGRVASG